MAFLRFFPYPYIRFRIVPRASSYDAARTAVTPTEPMPAYNV